MPTNMYLKAKKLLLTIKEKKGEKINSLDEVVKAIQMNIGGDMRRTVLPYLDLMKNTGLLQEKGDHAIIKC